MDTDVASNANKAEYRAWHPYGCSEQGRYDKNENESSKIAAIVRAAQDLCMLSDAKVPPHLAPSNARTVKNLYQSLKLIIEEWERVSEKGTVLNRQFSKTLNALKEEVNKRQNRKFRSDPEATHPITQEFDEWTDVAQILAHICQQQTFIPLDVFTEGLTLHEIADSVLDQKTQSGQGKVDAAATCIEAYSNFIKPTEQRTWGKGSVSPSEAPETTTKFADHEITCYAGEGLQKMISFMKELNARLASEPWLVQNIIRILWHNNDGVITLSAAMRKEIKRMLDESRWQEKDPYKDIPNGAHVGILELTHPLKWESMRQNAWTLVELCKPFQRVIFQGPGDEAIWETPYLNSSSAMVKEILHSSHATIFDNTATYKTMVKRSVPL